MAVHLTEFAHAPSVPYRSLPWSDDCVCIDFETTGFPPDGRPCALGFAQLLGGRVQHKGLLLMNPMCSVGDSERIHGLSDEALAVHPPWTEVMERVRPQLSGARLVVSMGVFDLAMLRECYPDSVLPPWRDGRELASWFGLKDRYASGHEAITGRSLDRMCKAAGVELDRSGGKHDALDDALALAHLLIKAFGEEA